MLELKAGINRINITEQLRGRGAYRFTESRKMQPTADILYRDMFNRIDAPLCPDVAQVNCSLKEFEAGYDHALGIDVVFKFANGTTATLQEKFLTTDWDTLTVEYMQDPDNNIPGDWFNMKCQYYFVGYYDTSHRELGFDRYAMVNWVDLQRYPLRWHDGRNNREVCGARASFRYVSIYAIPDRCIIARH